MIQTSDQIDNSLFGFNQNFTDVFNANYKRLCAYAFHFLNMRDVCEDVVQNTFFKLWNKRQTIDFSNCEGLLYKMVREASFDYLRSKKEISGIDNLEYVSDNSLVNEIIFAETVQEILNHINELSPKRREIVYQLIVNEKDNSEVAKEFNITESTVRTHKEKALEYFRAKLNKVAFGFIYLVSMVNI